MDGHFLKADPMNLQMLCNVDFLNRSAFFYSEETLCNLHAIVIMYIFYLISISYRSIHSFGRGYSEVELFYENGDETKRYTILQNELNAIK